MKGKIVHTERQDECEHLHSDGVAYKSMYYRLLIPLLTDRIETECFVSALHYQNESIPIGAEDFYSDILDGSVAIEHLDRMEKNYNAWCKHWKLLVGLWGTNNVFFCVLCDN